MNDSRLQHPSFVKGPGSSVAKYYQDPRCSLVVSALKPSNRLVQKRAVSIEETQPFTGLASKYETLASKKKHSEYSEAANDLRNGLNTSEHCLNKGQKIQEF